MNPFDKLYKPGKMTLGIEFPLDNDWSTEGNRKRLKTTDLLACRYLQSFSLSTTN